MRNIELWEESKFETRNGDLTYSRNLKNVSLSSRLMVRCISEFYNLAIPAHVKGHLLDLGCGNVPLYGAYKKNVTDITCVDWGNTIHKNSHLDIEADLNKPLELENSKYDTVILSDVLEHIRRPEELIKEINRVLKKGGKLILNVPFFYWLHEEPYDFFRYTKHALKSMCEENGFDIIYLEPLGGVPEIVADITAKYFIGIPLIGKLIAKIAQWKVFMLLKTSFGKKISIKSSQKFPLGYGLVAKKIII